MQFSLFFNLALIYASHQTQAYRYRSPRNSEPSQNSFLYDDIRYELTRNYQNFQSLLTSFISGITINENPLTVVDFWGYGCYCLPAGGMPLSGGYGEPVDALDRICFNRKRCISCLEINFPDNDNCDPESVRYRYEEKVDENGNIDARCTNKKGSCQRQTCECDLRLAREIRALLKNENGDGDSADDLYNLAHNLFKGNFDREAFCQKRHNGGATPDRCCDDGTGYFLSYSSLTHDCCENGSGGNSIRLIGTC